MIVEIESPKDSCIHALDYNENKVDGGVAELIAVHDVPQLDRKNIYELFARYERSSRYATKEVSFHASVNPSELDECSEDEVLRMIAEMMSSIGLGNQPYLVYRHFDIERIHYHVVSVRIDSTGHKVNNYFEKKKASAFLKSVSDAYHFTIPAKGFHVKSSQDLSKDKEALKRMTFLPSKGETDSQLKDVFSFALSYDFDGFDQFSRILKDMGIHAEQGRDGGPDGMMISLQGLDSKGRPCTKVRTEPDLALALYEQFSIASVSNKQSHHTHRREKERLRGVVSAAFKYSKSESHFENILRNKGISVHLSRTEAGDVFGVTFVDHLTKCVFKASEISDVISVGMMKDAVDSGHWRALDRGSSRNTYVKEKRQESQEAARTLKDINLGVVARILHPVGQPKGNSWNNKTKKTKEQLKEEFELDRSGAANSSFRDTTFDERLS